MSAHNKGWGIIGFGRAGQARVCALAELGQSIKGIATQRPRSADEWFKKNIGLNLQETPIFEDWRDLVQSSLIKGVFICSENQLHFEQAYQALSNGCHVCVEFPPCTNAEEATILYDLAKRNHCVFHVECIGTMTKRHLQLKSLVRNDQIDHLKFDFTGGLYRWVESAAQKEYVAHLAFGRLHQLIDLFGHITLCQSEIDMVSSHSSLKSYRLQAHFTVPNSTSSIHITLIENRVKGGKRANAVYATYQGRNLDIIKPIKGSLFTDDTNYFLQLCSAKNLKKLMDKGYSNPQDIMKTLRLIEEIHVYSIRVYTQ